MSLDREITGHTSRQDLEKPPPGRPAQAADPVAIGAQCKGPVGAPPPPARRQTLAPWPAKVPEGSTCTARGRKRALQSTAEEGASHAATRAGGARARRAGRPCGPGRPAPPRSWRPHAGQGHARPGRPAEGYQCHLFRRSRPSGYLSVHTIGSGRTDARSHPPGLLQLLLLECSGSACFLVVCQQPS